jgi:hypothetical protein
VTSFTDTHGNNVLDASLSTTAFVATATGTNLRLMATTGSATANGTEVTGGSYAAGGQVITWAAAATQSKASNAIVSFTGMPATTTNGVEVWDKGGTPARKHWGSISAKTTNAGDTLSFASGAVTVSFA